MSTQREIKFRVWDGKEMREPPPLNEWDMEDGEFWVSYCDNPIMQYTGLRDKNGREVYDGDLPGGIWEEHRVQWCHKCHGWSLGLVEVEGHCGQCDGDYMWRDFVDDVNEGKTTIIGNIHENPDPIP